MYRPGRPARCGSPCRSCPTTPPRSPSSPGCSTPPRAPRTGSTSADRIAAGGATAGVRNGHAPVRRSAGRQRAEVRGYLGADAVQTLQEARMSHSQRDVEEHLGSGGAARVGQEPVDDLLRRAEVDAVVRKELSLVAGSGQPRIEGRARADVGTQYVER